MADILTSREVADLFAVEEWRVRRIFESGDLPEPARFAGRRAIPRSMLPDIVDALRLHDWLPKREAAHA